MGTLASNRKGRITGASQSSYLDALAATTGTASDSETSSTTAMQYFQSSGRGGGTFRFIRTFLHFDTSDLSGGSNFQLQVISGGANGGATLSQVRAIKHSAFKEVSKQEGVSGFSERSRPGQKFFRSGKVGGYKSILSEAQVTKIINAHGDLLFEKGYITKGGRPKL